MLSYADLKDKPSQFLAVTSLTHEEFERVLPKFAEAYDERYPSTLNWKGQPRRRSRGGGMKGVLRHMEDKLLFILMYHKVYTIQAAHGLQFGLSQSQANYWIHRLLPVLQQALAQLGMTPEREGSHLAESLSPDVSPDLPPDLQIDGALIAHASAPKTPKRSARSTAASTKRIPTKTCCSLTNIPARLCFSARPSRAAYMTRKSPTKSPTSPTSVIRPLPR